MDIKTLTDLTDRFMVLAKRNLAGIPIRHEKSPISGEEIFITQVDYLLDSKNLTGNNREQLTADQVIGSTTTVLVQNHYRDVEDLFRLMRTTRLSKFNIKESLTSLEKLKGGKVGETVQEVHALAIDYLSKFTKETKIHRGSPPVPFRVQVLTTVGKPAVKVMLPNIGERVINKTRVETLFRIQAGAVGGPWEQVATLRIL